MQINQTLYDMSCKLTFKTENKQQQVELDNFTAKQNTHHDDAKRIYREKVEEDIKQTLLGLTKKVGDSRTLREEEDLENTKKGKAEKKKSIVVQKEENRLKNMVLQLAR